jgi:Ser/Thr protein kinase RdoA (MazF antagonist)
MEPGPVGVAAVPPLPHGRTARRLTWRFLPADVRALVEEDLGARVVHAESKDSGFTPGLASVVTAANGAQLFLKAASTVAQKGFADDYRLEARRREALGDAVPAPALRWVSDDDWVVLAFEAVDGRPPLRPWRPDELARTLDLAEEIARATTVVPPGLDLAPLWEEIPRLLSGWDEVPEWPHRDEAAALARRCPDVRDADRFLHADLRDDNVLLCGDGRTLACDWNWPALGPAWLDLVLLLVSAHGEGHDAEAMLRSSELTRKVEPEEIDAWLAAYCGFMLSSRGRPVPRNSPYLRIHAAWHAEATWAWLAQRRGW